MNKIADFTKITYSPAIETQYNPIPDKFKHNDTGSA